MMKLKSAFIFLLPILCILVLTTIVLAEEDVPAPYTGLKNPFEWSDTSTQKDGTDLYKRICLSCHSSGNGPGDIGGDLSTADFHKRLESNPALAFWRVSEGRGEMPAFKSTLSETQRWQVLTYIWSLGTPPVVEPVPPATPVTPPVVEPVPPATPVTPPVVDPVPPVTPVTPPVPINPQPQDQDGKIATYIGIIVVIIAIGIVVWLVLRRRTS